MGLFSTLLANKNSTETAETTKSSLDLPTVVQLYTGGTAPPLLQPRSVSYAALDYTAFSTEKGGAAGGKPDMGVWHCRCDFSDVLLPKVSIGNTAFAWTVDLSQPTMVEPSMAQMQAALVRHLIQHPPSASATTDGSATTTSLHDLKSVQFGLADKDTKKEASQVAPPDETDRTVKVSLIVAVKMPPVKTEEEDDDDYKTQQAVALLTYHLRKFCAAVNCSLVLVKDETTLPVLFKAFAQGEEIGTTPDDDEVVPEKEKGETKTDSSSSSSDNQVHSPSSSDTELIETVLLRNANYPGHWDAAKDSVWKILPVEQEKTSISKAKQLPSGDQAWLTELRESVGPVEGMQTPPPKANKPDANKTPNDAAVSSFFEGLLS